MSLNDKKICFITCVSNEEKYREALCYIARLKLPDGYEAECAAVRGAVSLAGGYNRAMKASDAKYKVYLHQDLFILNENFVPDMLKVFESDGNIGLMGVIGSLYLPADGVWFNSVDTIGSGYDNAKGGRMRLLVTRPIEGLYAEVKAVDGLIFATQHDLPFREDLFDGWHFYDVSQCAEYRRKGYRVVVPRQEKPWVLHDCGNISTQNDAFYNKYRNVFLDEYSKDFLPLVSILIPTYNRPDYFRKALDSALAQTYRNLEVVVCDDSTDDRTESLMRREYLGKRPNLRYYRNVENLGQFDNDLKLLRLAKGEYVNFLMDDDLLAANKLERMVSFFLMTGHEKLSVCTSHRVVIDGEGRQQSIFGNTNSLINKDYLVPGQLLVDHMLKFNFNLIGEPTTVLFKKSKLTVPFGTFGGRRYLCNVDQAAWMELLTGGEAAFLNDALSSYRWHGDQQLKGIKAVLGGAADYAHSVITARALGRFLTADADYLQALKSCSQYMDAVLNKAPSGGLDRENAALRAECLDWQEKLAAELSARGTARIPPAPASLPPTVDPPPPIPDRATAKPLPKTEAAPAQTGPAAVPQPKRSDAPLVSLIIPCFNQTKYLKATLESALAQTYPNLEIIVGDDSTTDDVRRLVNPYLSKYRNLRYMKNRKAKSEYGLSNANKCLNVCRGEFVSYLFHDDLILPDKITLMMNYAATLPNVSLVTSVRLPIDASGAFVDTAKADPAFRPLTDRDLLIGSRSLIRSCLVSMKNLIGEPSVFLVKKSCLDKRGVQFFGGVSTITNTDLAMAFTALEHGNAVYIAKPLTYFRVHDGQNSSKSFFQLGGHIDWLSLLMACKEKGYIESLEEYRSLLRKYAVTSLACLCPDSELKSFPQESKKLRSLIEKAVNEIFSDEKDPCLCTVCGKTSLQFTPHPSHRELMRSHGYDVEADKAETCNLSRYLCPFCGACDRERLYAKYLAEQLKGREKKARLLDIAPAKALSAFIKKELPVEYVSADLLVKGVNYNLDISDMHVFEDESFDVFICSHVLEHVRDDRKAISELCRILKKDGFGILMVPIDLNQKEIEENPDADLAERWSHFGQDDHIRKYSKQGFLQRVREGGFEVSQLGADYFGAETLERLGLSDTSVLYVVRKG